jgi:hypothetical protein
MLQKLQLKKSHILGIIISVLVLQLYSLIRNYTEAPKCGRFVEPIARLKVLINCDSAVFMKDAEEPKRLFDGTSDYQDRPAYSLINSLLLKISRTISLPEKIFPVKGVSGEIYNYSSTVYIIFILLNSIILMLAIAAVIGVFSDVALASHRDTKTKFYFIGIAIAVLAANELTKTFFWTPHSQMFNLLQPALALYFIHQIRSIATVKRFLHFCAYLLILTFFYPSVALLATILLFAPVRSIFWRLATIAATFSVYAAYPYFISLLGGDYRSNHISKFREFIWVWDGLKDGSLPQSIVKNAESFLLTFPVIPSALILLFFIIMIYINKEFNKNTFKRALTSPFSFFIFTYVSYLYFLGFYSRRLTLGLIVFLALTLLLYSMKKTPPKLAHYTPYVAMFFGLFILSSWIFTSGPLV